MRTQSPKEITFLLVAWAMEMSGRQSVLKHQPSQWSRRIRER